MKLDLKNKVTQRIFVYSASLIIAIIAFLLLTRINDIIGFIGGIVSLLSPFLIGFGLAFIFEGPVLWFENRLSPYMKRSKARALSVALVVVIFILFFVFTLWVLIPSLIDSVQIFVRNFSQYSTQFENTLQALADKYNLDISAVISFIQNLDISSTINYALSASMAKMMSYSYNIIHWVTNLVIALAAAVYMILDKKNLLMTMRLLIYTIFNKRTGNFIHLYSMDAKNVFQQYIVGNLVDSLIVGLMAAFGSLLLGLPYAPMIGLIIGITNIIPVFGPFLGGVPVVALLFMIKPTYGLIFAVFILLIQQIDGNVLKPVILGDKLGISGFWILFSVSIGGALFGPIGMLLGVPIFALVYEGFKDFALFRIAGQHLTLPSSAVIVEEEDEWDDDDIRNDEQKVGRIEN